jgi:hypothetical protein
MTHDSVNRERQNSSDCTDDGTPTPAESPIRFVVVAVYESDEHLPSVIGAFDSLQLAGERVAGACIDAVADAEDSEIVGEVLARFRSHRLGADDTTGCDWEYLPVEDTCTLLASDAVRARRLPYPLHARWSDAEGRYVREWRILPL